MGMGGGGLTPLPFSKGCEWLLRHSEGRSRWGWARPWAHETTRAVTPVRGSREESLHFPGTEGKILPWETFPLDSAFPILLVKSPGSHGRIPGQRGA